MNSTIKILLFGMLFLPYLGFSQETSGNTYASHTPKPTDVPSISAKLSGTEYTVQVGAFIKPSNAEKLRQKFSDKGYTAEVLENLLDGKRLYYLVWVGSFSEVEDAEKTISSIYDEFQIKGVLRPRSSWHR